MNTIEDIEKLLQRHQTELNQFYLESDSRKETEPNFGDILGAVNTKTDSINAKTTQSQWVDSVLVSAVTDPSLEALMQATLATALSQKTTEEANKDLSRLYQYARSVTTHYLDGREAELMIETPNNFRLKLAQMLNENFRTIGIENQGIKDAIIAKTFDNLSGIVSEIDGKLVINSEALRKIKNEVALTEEEVEKVKGSIKTFSARLNNTANHLEKRMLTGERAQATTQNMLENHIKTAERWWKANQLERQTEQFRQNAVDTFKFFNSIGEFSHSRTLQQIGTFGLCTVQFFDGLSKLQNLSTTFQGVSNLSKVSHLTNGMSGLTGLTTAAQGIFAVAGPIGSMVAAFLPIISALRKSKQQGPNPFSEILKHQSYMFSQIMNGLIMIDHRLVAIHKDIHNIQKMLCEIANRQISEFFDIKSFLVYGLEKVQNNIRKMHSDLKRRAEDILLTPLQEALFIIQDEDHGNSISNKSEYIEYRRKLLFWLKEKATDPIWNGRSLAEHDDLQITFSPQEMNTILAFCGIQTLDFRSATRHMGNLIGYLAEYVKTLFSTSELSNNPKLFALLNTRFVNPLIWLQIIEHYEPLVKNIAKNHPDWLGKEGLNAVIKNGEDVVHFIKMIRTQEVLIPRLFDNYNRALREVYECIDSQVKEANKKLNESNTHASRISILDNAALKLEDFRNLRPLNESAKYGDIELKSDVFYESLAKHGLSIPSELLLLERLENPKIELLFTDYARALDGRVKMAFSCTIKVKYGEVDLIKNQYMTGQINKSEGYTLPYLWGVGNSFFSDYGVPEADNKSLAESSAAALTKINQKLNQLRKEVLNKVLEPGSASNLMLKKTLERLQSAYLILKAFLILVGYKLDENEQHYFWDQERIMQELNYMNNSVHEQLPVFMTQMNQLSEITQEGRKVMLERIFSGQGIEPQTLESILEVRLACLKQLARSIDPNYAMHSHQANTLEIKRRSEIHNTAERTANTGFLPQYQSHTNNMMNLEELFPNDGSGPRQNLPPLIMSNKKNLNGNKKD